MLIECIKIKTPNHESDPDHTKTKFYIKALRFSKLKGKEEEGQCGKFGGRFKLGFDLKSQRKSPKLFVFQTGPIPVGDGGSATQPIDLKLSPEVPRTVGYKTHQGIRRKLGQNPAARRKAWCVVFRLTGEGEGNRA